ncbi:helix-turn-helix domain-containing protein [Thalassobacillus sp. C254]|uniref:helix-turn-helix domain-containing protein n=1 Tax=Thalassobacillus sp. C254 TaxID=1225341 RepID=UPI0006D0EE78|nr:helix-turn-helix transcriptional regulator [Thalassobacillus sp. C254]
MDIGQRIKKLREKREWSQRHLADKVNLNYSVMNRIEAGKRAVSDEEIKKFADSLDTTSDYLLGRTEYDGPYKTAFDDPNATVFARHGKPLTDDEKEYLEEQLRLYRQSKKKWGK